MSEASGGGPHERTVGPEVDLSISARLGVLRMPLAEALRKYVQPAFGTLSARVCDEACRAGKEWAADADGVVLHIKPVTPNVGVEPPAEACRSGSARTTG